MTTPAFYTDGQGKGHLPLQPHPKNKTTAVYTEELTHLFGLLQDGDVGVCVFPEGEEVAIRN